MASLYFLLEVTFFAYSVIVEAKLIYFLSVHSKRVNVFSFQMAWQLLSSQTEGEKSVLFINPDSRSFNSP